MNKIESNKNMFYTQSGNGTGKDGLHRAGGFLDAAYQSFESGRLAISADDSQVEISIDGKPYVLPVAVVAQAYIELPYSVTGSIDDKSRELVERLELLKAGFLTKAQSNFAKSGQPAQSKPVSTTFVLTAEEYKTNCLKLAQIDTVALFSAIESVSDKTSKQDLLAIIETLRAQLFTAEQAETYAVMLEKEAALNIAKSLGFEKIQKSMTGAGEVYLAEIPADLWKANKSEFESAYNRLSIVAKERDEFDFPTIFGVTFRLKA